MKSITILCLLVVAVSGSPRPASQYTARYDDVNLEEILSNRRLLIPYLKCALEQGKCTPEGKELRSHIREALEDGCSKCTETQRKGGRRVIGHLINREQGYWNQLKAKYDPAGKYTKKYEKELKTVS